MLHPTLSSPDRLLSMMEHPYGTVPFCVEILIRLLLASVPMCKRGVSFTLLGTHQQVNLSLLFYCNLFIFGIKISSVLVFSMVFVTTVSVEDALKLVATASLVCHA